MCLVHVSCRCHPNHTMHALSRSSTAPEAPTSCDEVLGGECHWVCQSPTPLLSILVGLSTGVELIFRTWVFWILYIVLFLLLWYWWIGRGVLAHVCVRVGVLESMAKESWMNWRVPSKLLEGIRVHITAVPTLLWTMCHTSPNTLPYQQTKETRWSFHF